MSAVGCLFRVYCLCFGHIKHSLTTRLSKLYFATSFCMLSYTHVKSSVKIKHPFPFAIFSFMFDSFVFTFLFTMTSL